jgi:methionyl-tRNA formyltransferase
VHASLLPRWRGAAPIHRAIEAGDIKTGITIMQMDEGLDTGDMLLESECRIDANDTTATLQNKLAVIGAPALNLVIEQLANGRANPVRQDSRLSCYADKISKAEAAIDWQQPAEQIERKVRAFNPFPTAYTSLGKERLKVWQAEVNPDRSGNPGTILETGKNGVLVACGEGSLCLQQIQLPGGKVLDTAAVLNSRAALFAVGSVLGET